MNSLLRDFLDPTIPLTDLPDARGLSIPDLLAYFHTREVAVILDAFVAFATRTTRLAAARAGIAAVPAPFPPLPTRRTRRAAPRAGIDAVHALDRLITTIVADEPNPPVDQHRTRSRATAQRACATLLAAAKIPRPHKPPPSTAPS